MAVLADIAHFYGGDIGVSSTGDIALVSGGDRTTQRVVRRLITAATSAFQSEYPWEPGYGVGMGERVGDVGVDPRGLEALVRGQLLMERSVAAAPAPKVTVTEVVSGTFEIDCSYADQSGLIRNFSFDLGPAQ